MIARLAPLLLLSAVAAIAHAQDMPPISKPLTPPVGTEREPASRVTLADYRYDDLLWENDRTAHRIYGHALEAAEPPSGSGIDAWGKNVRWPFADRQLRTGDQHAYHGEGIDFYNVGTGRGMGGLGIWYDDKLWTSRNYRTYRILSDGPAAADFEVEYAPWPIDVGRKVWETRRFTLPLGTNFTRMVSTLSSDKPGDIIVGIGIGKRTTGAGGDLTVDRVTGVLSWWGPQDGEHGRMGIAIRVNPATIVAVRDDADNHLVLVKATPGKPFVYYAGSTWDKGVSGFRTRAAWDAYASSERLDFIVPKDTK